MEEDQDMHEEKELWGEWTMETKISRHWTASPNPKLHATWINDHALILVMEFWPFNSQDPIINSPL